jgi:hypothetical protein
MSWKNVADRHKNLFEGNQVTFAQPLERKFIIQVIAEEFPHQSRVRIASAIDQCVKINSTPINRNQFIDFVQYYIR